MGAGFCSGVKESLVFSLIATVHPDRSAAKRISLRNSIAFLGLSIHPESKRSCKPSGSWAGKNCCMGDGFNNGITAKTPLCARRVSIVSYVFNSNNTNPVEKKKGLRTTGSQALDYRRQPADAQKR
jgi:hypothetical protein